VILLAPYWVSYLDHITFAEGKPVIIQTTIESDFKVTPGQLETALTPNTRLLIFNSPSNPTGMVYTREEMAGLVKVLEKFPQVIIVSDEIYEHITFTGQHVSLATFSSIADRVVTVNGVSKGYAMTGWRIGYMGAPLWLAKACNKLQGQFTSGVSSIAQRAALAAVTSKSDSKERMREAFLRRRDLICSLLEDIPGLKVRVPQGAFYVMPDISSFIGKSYNGQVMKDADDLTFFLLAEARVAMVSGSAFGADSCIRISYATSDDRITEAVRRIKEALAKLS
jgi:aspartate aminotransferase